MLFAAFLILGLIHGQGRAERILRWFAAKLRFDADTAADALRKVGERVEDLVENRAVLGRVVLGSTCAWLLDATSLWVFIRAFGSTVHPLDLLIAFGLANIVAVIPITPGGLGIVEGVYIPTLVGFGLTRRVATLGVASYRLAQYWFPIVLGGILYASLRVGPWSIERRDRLDRLRDIANRETDESERRIEFAMRSWERKGAAAAKPPRTADAGGAAGTAGARGPRIDGRRGPDRSRRGPGLGTAAAARPAVAGDARPVARARRRGDAAADPGATGDPEVARVLRRLPDAGGVCRRHARRRAAEVAGPRLSPSGPRPARRRGP